MQVKQIFVKMHFSQNVYSLICQDIFDLVSAGLHCSFLHSPMKPNIFTQCKNLLFPCPSVDLISPNQHLEEEIFIFKYLQLLISVEILF